MMAPTCTVVAAHEMCLDRSVRSDLNRFQSFSPKCQHLTKSLLKKGSSNNNIFRVFMEMQRDICNRCYCILTAWIINNTSKDKAFRCFIGDGSSLLLQRSIPTFIRFYWHHSELWKNLIRSDAIFSKTLYSVSTLVILIRSLRWMKPYHWKHLVLKRRLLDYIIEMYIKGVSHSTDDGVPVHGLIMNANALLTIITSDLSTEKYGNEYINYCKRRISHVDELIWGNYSSKQKEKYSIQIREIVNKYQRNYWTEFYAKEKCMRLQCENTRGRKGVDRIGFVLCKKCKIASYCSRRCAKLDWNRGSHKEYCQSYADISERRDDD